MKHLQVYYLNLARRPDRNERFLKVNAGIAEFCRMAAVDGDSVRNEDLVADGVIVEPLHSYTSGALGCALSHLRMLDFCISRQTPVTVAEDDAVFNRHFPTRATDTLTLLPADWDLILWGWNFDSILHVRAIDGIKDTVMYFDGPKLGPRLVEFQNSPHRVLPLRLVQTFGTVCYTVSPHGAEFLRKNCFPLKNEGVSIPSMKRLIHNLNIDSVMNKHYASMKAFVAFPPLVWTEHDRATSDVNPTKTW